MILSAAFLVVAQPASAAAPIHPVESAAPAPFDRPLALPDDAVAYVPSSAGPHPPLLVLLHGAGRTRMWMIDHFRAQADKRGILLLAPTSLGATWDAISAAQESRSPGSALAERMGHRYGGSRDSRRVDAAIANLAKLVPFDLSRVVLAGFSDGATFALAMGMARSQHFSAVIAWSPGIAIETSQPARGRRVFVSHGRSDPVLSYSTDCGEIVPLLQGEGANVTFLPFDGVHEVPETAKDIFLDAAFGPVSGAPPHPLPTGEAACNAKPGSREIPVY